MDEMNTTPAMPQKSGNMLAWVLLVVAVAGIGAAGYFYKVKMDLTADPTKVAAQKTAEVVAQVGKLISLPAETPTILTVTDLNALKGRPFFEKAQVGDLLLIYTTAQEAVLYSPARNVIVQVAGLSLNNTK
jgi:hypothetical protein